MGSTERLNKQNPKIKNHLEPFSLIKNLPRTVKPEENTGIKTVRKPKSCSGHPHFIYVRSFFKD